MERYILFGTGSRGGSKSYRRKFCGNNKNKGKTTEWGNLRCVLENDLYLLAKQYENYFYTQHELVNVAL